jgi:hypothetical protein
MVNHQCHYTRMSGRNPSDSLVGFIGIGNRASKFTQNHRPVLSKSSPEGEGFSPILQYRNLTGPVENFSWLPKMRGDAP